MSTLPMRLRALVSGVSSWNDLIPCNMIKIETTSAAAPTSHTKLAAMVAPTIPTTFSVIPGLVEG